MELETCAVRVIILHNDILEVRFLYEILTLKVKVVYLQQKTYLNYAE